MENLIPLPNKIKTIGGDMLRLPCHFTQHQTFVKECGEVDTSTPHFIEGCIRILKAMLVEDFMPYDQIVNHLDYLIHILILLQKYSVRQVIGYDEAYRTEQFNEGYIWGVEKPLLESMYLAKPEFQNSVVEPVYHDELPQHESDSAIIDDKTLIKKELVGATDASVDSMQDVKPDQTSFNFHNEMQSEELNRSKETTLESENSHDSVGEFEDDPGFTEQNIEIIKASTSRKGKGLACPVCGKKFKQQRGLETHMQKHTGEKAFKCPICNKAFAQKYILNRHMVVHEDKKHCCSICGKLYQHKEALQRHMQAHTGQLPHICRFCAKGFVTISKLIIHERVHTGEKPFVCEICGKAFSIQSNLNQHYHEHVGANHKCPQCDKSFYTALRLKAHMICHTDERPHICEICTESFKYQQHLKRHLETHHEMKRHACQQCDKTFASKRGLQAHVVKHSGEEGKKHVCHTCGTKYFTASQLTNHSRTHTGEKPYQCSYCEKSFSQSTARIRHERIHTGEKPYKCEVCDQAFNDSSTLKKHMFVHNREKPYVCNVCNKSFPWSHLLTKHIESHIIEFG